MDQADENTRRQKIDRWLDAALQHYSEDGPRAGLEARVLATLEADRREREQNRYQWPWRLVLAAGLAAVLIMVIIRGPWRSTERPTSTPPAVTATIAPAGTQPKSQPPVATLAKTNSVPGAKTRRSPQPLVVVRETSGPRLAQFPAPRPPSEQERLLVALVDNSSPEQLARDADVQQRVRREVEEAEVSGGGMLEPRGK